MIPSSARRTAIERPPLRVGLLGLVAAVLAVLAWGSGSAYGTPATTAPAIAISTFNYEQHLDAAAEGPAAERGPPRLSAASTAYDAVDYVSHGVSACPCTTTGAGPTHRATGRLAGAAPATGTTTTPAELIVGAELSVQRWTVAAEAGDRVVIGKMADITADGAIGPGERTILDQLPDLGTVEANWAQNERVLLQEMKSRNPIRDASLDSAGNPGNNTGFLYFERATLIREGWTFNPSTSLGSPGG